MSFHSLSPWERVRVRAWRAKLNNTLSLFREAAPHEKGELFTGLLCAKLRTLTPALSQKERELSNPQLLRIPRAVRDDELRSRAFEHVPGFHQATIKIDESIIRQ